MSGDGRDGEARACCPAFSLTRMSSAGSPSTAASASRPLGAVAKSIEDMETDKSFVKIQIDLDAA